MSEIAYTAKAQYEQDLQDFVKQGEAEPEYNSLFSSSSADPSETPKQPPIGLRSKLPPFKGWAEDKPTTSKN